jgi:hypothetical protein
MLDSLAIHSMFSGELIAMVWRDVHMLTYTHNAPADNTFYDKHGNAIKPDIV